MNIENFKLVIEHVATNPQFDMQVINHSCGSAACIIGSAAFVSEIYDDKDLAKWLDVDLDDFYYIYGGDFSSNPLKDITRDEAVDYLNRCVIAGEVLGG